MHLSTIALNARTADLPSEATESACTPDLCGQFLTILNDWNCLFKFSDVEQFGSLNDLNGIYSTVELAMGRLA